MCSIFELEIKDDVGEVFELVRKVMLNLRLNG